jgi:hypothetical protein
MTAELEHEIIELYRQLDKDAQQRVRAVIERVIEVNPPMSHEEWVAFIHATYGSLADDPLDEV